MLWLWIIPGVIVFFGLIILMGSLVMLRKMPSISKPLSESDVSICAEIVKGRRAGRPVTPYPFVCSWAVRHSACPCLPCKKLEQAKSGTN